MSPLFKKLNLKDQPEIVVLNAPDSFATELAALGELTIHQDIDRATAIAFSLAFVTKQEEVDNLAKAIAAKAPGDATIWFAYPKSSSPKYTCEFNRDTGWAELGRLGFEGVRQVAIDADWSALRFRRVAYIKSLIRDKTRALTAEGQRRVADS